MTFLANTAVADEYWSNSRKRLNITISNSGINRIEVEKDRILKVVGQQEDYNIEGDFSKGFVFISTALAAGNILPITIITEKGLTQDLSLLVKGDIAPITITIKRFEKTKSKAVESTIDENMETQVLNVLQDIIIGDIRNLSFRTVDANEIKHLNFKVERATAYSNKHLTIFKYEYIENPTVSVCFPDALAVARRTNAIFVVYKL